MKAKMHLFYDEEGDMLEIRMGSAKNSYMKETKDGVFERIDEKTGKVRGFTILNFKKKTGRCKSVDINFPAKIDAHA